MSRKTLSAFMPVLVMVAGLAGAAYGQAVLQELDVLQDYGPDRVLQDANFYIEGRPNYNGAQWIFDQHTNNLIGYAPWDAVKRRWTLFNLRGEYYGFIQAIMGQFHHPPHYLQYLWYDKDNRYKGFFVRGLGGRPVTPDLPFGELGGQMHVYLFGNFPLDLPDYTIETDPLKQFPLEVDVSPVQRDE
ncbi:MAG: hypothetical protein V1792_01820 [Pseudomonadota bacterium]